VCPRQRIEKRNMLKCEVKRTCSQIKETSNIRNKANGTLNRMRERERNKDCEEQGTWNTKKRQEELVMVAAREGAGYTVI
jgi:hypothetical protein